MLSNSNNELSSSVVKATFLIFAKEKYKWLFNFLFSLMHSNFIYVIVLIKQFTRFCFFSLTIVDEGKVANLGLQNKEAQPLYTRSKTLLQS